MSGNICGYFIKLNQLDSWISEQRKITEIYSPTVMKLGVKWAGVSLPHVTKFHKCRCKFAYSRTFLIWPMVHRLSPSITDRYRKISNISHTKSQSLNDSHLVLQSFLPNPLRPGVKSRMKIWLEQRQQAMLQLYLSYQQLNCQLRCDLY